MRNNILSLLLVIFWQTVFSQDKMPYQIFERSGQESSYKSMLKSSSKAAVVLFGEHHDNAIAHWLQLELLKDLAESKKLILGAEMFEADNQIALDRYLNGEINQKALDTLARLWPNYKTDYKPLVDFAKANKMPFVATNIPRRFANNVYKNGFQSLEVLSPTEKSWIAPLPIVYDPTLPGYVKIVEEMGGHGGDNLPKAQAIKDATMAFFIEKNSKPKTVFVHFNGSYHSDNYEGICWYLRKNNPKLDIVTISVVTQGDVRRFQKENLNKADFIIVVDEDVTKTH
jgi:uncharacterized iron-regulated protein